MRGQINGGGPSYAGSKQLCWDCANATNGGCSWSRDFTPVPGWTARRIPGRVYHGGQATEETYMITACPEFLRDAYGYGRRRMDKGR